MDQTARVSRQLLDAIAGFRSAYQADPKFKTILADLSDAEEKVETLVPAAADTTADAADSTPARTLPEAAAKTRALLKGQRTRQQQEAAESGESS